MTAAAHVADVDVLIVGAGLSGIGAACHLQRELPATSYLILEARAAMGGTWDLFRYPGVRSDSDMYTLGYAFRPWRGDHALADGDDIRGYIEDTAREYAVERHIRYRHKVIRAEWSSPDARWTVTAQRTAADGSTSEVTVTARFLYACSGYYDYDNPHEADIPGLADFGGQVVHPQSWPADLDYTGKRVVVIGSGATAITLVPAMARGGAEHVTMLQRSPTYVLNMPSHDPVAALAERALPARAAYGVIRWSHILQSWGLYRLSRRRPGLVRRFLRSDAAKLLPADYPLDVHFNPRYDPWDQRLCAVPGADLFRAIASGRASVVTDHVERFLPRGIRLRYGAQACQQGRALPANRATKGMPGRRHAAAMRQRSWEDPGGPSMRRVTT